ncbi:MAG: LLM class F420-dependent oxidoreductase [Novosphingobium sp.]|nr:LLM class F420-dependent oxidoreductase [Novosphingobium sp.]MCP5403389.1 LLM class F420-dependent oxidoreductase [Novosphingobium sp.]
MKVGITCGGIGPYASGDFLRRSVQAAEQVGFAHYWIPDHVILFAAYPQSKYPYAEGSGQQVPDQDPDAPLQFGDDTFALVDPTVAFADPVVAMTWLAAVTSTIEIGSNVLILPQRHPIILAKELATLDACCGGRTILGIGAGWAKEDFDAIGVDFGERGRRTNEMMQAMQALWRDDSSSFSGEFYDFKDAYCYPKPARPGGVPMLVGGESKPARRRVARLGDGWLPYNLPLSEAAGAIDEIRAMTRDAGRDPDKLRICKIIYDNAEIDDLKRYRDAGVTEFNVASNGDIPLDETGMQAKFAEFRDRIVGPIGEL